MSIDTARTDVGSTPVTAKDSERIYKVFAELIFENLIRSIIDCTNAMDIWL